MTYLAILDLLLKYGPQAVVMGQKLVANIQAGRGNANATAEDWAELARLGSLTSSDIYKEAGITPPPPVSVAPGQA